MNRPWGGFAAVARSFELPGVRGSKSPDYLPLVVARWRQPWSESAASGGLLQHPLQEH